MPDPDGPRSSPATEFAARLAGGGATVGIIGLGYVGLPLARAFVGAGLAVLGFDTDPTKVARLLEGRSYIGHVGDDVVAALRGTGRFDATADFARLAEPDAIVICVPTPLGEAREPDLSAVIASSRAVARALRPGQLVVLESTTYPGTTRDVVLPILLESRLIPGRDFFLAYSPEREDPGNPTHSAPTIPKVVGGLDPISLDLAATLYERAVVRVERVSSPEVAEAAKILENTYRAVNIALVNELKLLYDRMGIDVWEVIDAARTKPFGFQAFYPGPGLGGHCIPIDPFYLTWVARKHAASTRFIELAGEINTSMPAYVIARVADALNDASLPVRGSKITLLGMAYKRDVDDPRESPGFELMDLLLARGAEVEYNDPHIPTLPPMRRYPHIGPLVSRELTPDYLASRDLILIVTDHSAYDWPSVVAHARIVVDTRGATRRVVEGREKIRRA